MIQYKMVKLEEGIEEDHYCNIPSEKMPICRTPIGAAGDDSHPELLKPALAEFFSTIIFVFAGEGSTMALYKLNEGNANTQASLIAAALAHAFALFVAVSVGANISGGHVNPAVTFGAYVGGNINLLRLQYYWAAQLLGSVVACILLKISTGGLNTAAFILPSDVSVWSALVLEIVMTFGLVYTVYATAIEPNKGQIGGIAPLAIGFIAGANILAGGAFDGASMNPAVSFGPALVSWTWSHHWVYWCGPLIGGGAAALIYDNFLMSDPPQEPLPTVF